MTRPSRIALRLISGVALLTATLVAAFGIVLWSDPEAAIFALRGTPHGRVRSEATVHAGQVHEASRLTTSGGLELELLVVRPDAQDPVPLCLLAVESSSLTEVAAALPGVDSMAFGLLGCEARDAGLFGLRESADRATASFLAAYDELKDELWLNPDRVQLAGHGPFGSSAHLASKLEEAIQGARRLGAPASPPAGVRGWLAHQLAHGGSRSAPEESEVLAPSGSGSGAGVAAEVRRFAAEFAASDPGTSRDTLQPIAR